MCSIKKENQGPILFRVVVGLELCHFFYVNYSLKMTRLKLRFTAEQVFH